MKKQLSKHDECILRDQLPMGFFLAGNADENLRYLFDAPELINRGPGPIPERERQTIVNPLIVAALVLVCVLLGVWQGVGGA